MVHQKKARTPGQPPSLTTTDDAGKLKIIKAEKNTRILGCNIQENIHWQGHLETGEKPALPDLQRKLGAIRHLSKQLPQGCKKILVNGIILSKLVYLIPIWGNTYPKYLNKAQAILNNAARLITGRPKKTSTKVLMEECDWLDVRELTKYHSLMRMWNILWRQKPVQISDKITWNEDGKIETSKPRLQTT